MAVYKITPQYSMISEPVYLVPEMCDEIQQCADITSVKTDSGVRFPAQRYKDGIIAVITADAGKTLCLTEDREPCGGCEVLCNPNSFEVKINGSHFSDYVFDEKLYKPYFGAVSDDDGNSFTRLDFETKEHPHHRSVFVAIGDVNGVDLWNEPANCGIIRTKNISDVVCGSAFASFTANNCWHTHGMEPLLDEKTKYTVYNQSGELRMLDMEIKLSAAYGDVTFGPTKEAGPLGIRVRDELRADSGCGTILNAEGGTGEAECWGKSSRWCSYSGDLDIIGHIGIAVLDNPDNERFPTAWHVRNYGLFAANNLYFKGGYNLNSGESVTYKYRIIFSRRRISADETELHSKNYAELCL